VATVCPECGFTYRLNEAEEAGSAIIDDALGLAGVLRDDTADVR